MSVDPESPAPNGPRPKSWGNIGPEHWSRTRADANQEALEHLRQRSRAPGVESGGSHRNSYCMECNGVLPLEYDSRVAGQRDTPSECPHCGAPIEGRVQAMFNWVEIDQVAGGDARFVLPVLVLLLLLVALVIWIAI